LVGGTVSRIGRSPIAIPKGVTVETKDRKIIAKGKLGTLDYHLLEGIDVINENSELRVLRKDDSKVQREIHGLTRALINNMVIGVSEGFVKELHVVGLGYTAEVVGPWLKLAMGYSHEILLQIPEGITVEVEQITKAKGSRTAVQSKIFVKGFHKEDVGKFAAEVRAVRPPDNYKGKGIRYSYETVIIKAGKTGK